MGLISRLLAARGARARHNDYDDRCDYWYGDRSPARERKGPWVWSGYKDVPITLRNMDGSPTMTSENRCGVCNPYTELESDALIDFELTGEIPDGYWWHGSILVGPPLPTAGIEGHR